MITSNSDKTVRTGHDNVPTATGGSGGGGFWRAPFRARTWLCTAYGVLSFPTGVLWFALTVPGLLVSTVLMVVFLLGIPFLFLFFGVARVCGLVERARARVFLGVDIQEPVRGGARGRGIWGRLGARIGDGRTLREIAYVVVNLPFGFALTFASLYPWVQTCYSLSYPFVHWNDTFSVHAWGGPSWIGAVSVHTLPGFLTLFLGPWLIRGMTWLHGKFIKVMLGP